MEVRESLSIIAGRLSQDRWIVLFLLLHVIGVHWLAGSRRVWLKSFAAACLLASVPCWVNAVHLSPSMLGANRQTSAALASLLLLSGLWLFLTGNGPSEWLCGFALAVLGGVVILFSIRQPWAASASAALVIPLVGARIWFLRWKTNDASLASIGERLISVIATAAIAVVVALCISELPLTRPDDSAFRSRLRDFVTQPSILFLLAAGSIAVVSTSIRLWPAAEEE